MQKSSANPANMFMVSRNFKWAKLIFFEKSAIRKCCKGYGAGNDDYE